MHKEAELQKNSREFMKPITSIANSNNPDEELVASKAAEWYAAWKSAGKALSFMHIQ